MGNIANLINNIKTAIFGKDVRKSICDAIEQCYEDAGKNGNANMEVIKARKTYDTLNDRLNADRNDLKCEIESLASGSPLVASSVGGMSDTSRVYVNTADGHWYWHNGTSWQDGGVYQATEISENNPIIQELKNKKIYLDETNKNRIIVLSNKLKGGNNLYCEENNGVYRLYTTGVSGSGWAYSKNNFTPKENCLVKVEFDYNATVMPSSGITVFVGKPNSIASDDRFSIYSTSETNGHVEVTYDPNYYKENKNLTETVLWIICNGKPFDLTISNFNISQSYSTSILNSIEGDNAAELFENIDKILTNIKVNGVTEVKNVKNVELCNEIVKGSGGTLEQNNQSYRYYNLSTTAGTNWLFSKDTFLPDGGELVTVEFDYDATIMPSSYFEIRLGKSTSEVSSDRFKLITLTEKSGHVKFTFDPAFYEVYHGITDCRLWFLFSGRPFDVTISNFKVYQKYYIAKTSNFSGNNVKELFESVDSILQDIKARISNNITLISPNGKKFILEITNEGVVIPIPVNPSKAYFFGNSLLLGNETFGLDATDNEHDYYHLITEYIKNNVNEDFISNKSSGTAFESLTTEITQEQIETIFTSHLDSSINLVSIQLGDNVNTDSKLAVFRNNVIKVCKAIKQVCPNARIVWHGMWYTNAEKSELLESACNEANIKFISYSGLRTAETNSYVGHVKYKDLATRTVENVTEVVENSNNNITVKFIVNDTVYTSDDFYVDNWSLIAGTLTYTSTAQVTTSTGSASHPGDKGFKRIANRFLYQMGYSDTEEYYK